MKFCLFQRSAVLSLIFKNGDAEEHDTVVPLKANLSVNMAWEYGQ